uniref:Uncharacterized protein n=1 Tax=Arundo donax TaxID=35708 RepID=A0A0A8YRW3_ARUDO
MAEKGLVLPRDPENRRDLMHGLSSSRD